MTALSERFAAGACASVMTQERRTAREARWSYAHRRLTTVFNTAPEIPFDYSSRFIFFSDCHRGDGSRVDAFRRNRDLFLHALNHYHDLGYIYVEVGDGDELWKGWSFQAVRRAYGQIFDVLHRLQQEGRLHLIAGNHDLDRNRHGPVDKDGLIARDGLILRHAQTGQRLFVIHGHQADLKSDYFSQVSRLAVGYVWTRLQLLGLVGTTGPARETWKLSRMQRAIMSWAQARRQIVICGHTHRAMSPAPGAPPYLNTGSCIFPDCITGLELTGGQFSLVRWVAHGGGRIARQLIAPSRALHTFV